MSAVAGLQSPRLRTLRPRAPALAASPRLALLGTGTVGAAWVERYTRLQGTGIELPALAWLANSRAVQPAAGDLVAMLEQANAAPRRERALQGWAEADALQAGDILVDATASDTVAGWHPEWLARGVHVVTANKLGHGSLLARSQAIAQAQVHGRARYGDSATVGAGLPVLSSLRALVAGGAGQDQQLAAHVLAGQVDARIRLGVAGRGGFAHQRRARPRAVIGPQQPRQRTRQHPFHAMDAITARHQGAQAAQQWQARTDRGGVTIARARGLRRVGDGTGA